MKTAAAPIIKRGFTLIEILVVIAVIAILAGLFLSLSGSASHRKKIDRVKVELAQLSVMIDGYHDKLGFYPPDNPSDPRQNTLFYELSGTKFDLPSLTYTTLGSSISVTSNDVFAVFLTRGFANSSTDPSEARDFSKGLRLSQFTGFTNHAAFPAQVNLLVVPVEGPQPGINPWRYVSTNPTNNPHGYDLWAEIVISGKTNIIGNWKN